MPLDRYITLQGDSCYSCTIRNRLLVLKCRTPTYQELREASRISQFLLSKPMSWPLGRVVSSGSNRINALQGIVALKGVVIHEITVDHLGAIGQFQIWFCYPTYRPFPWTPPSKQIIMSMNKHNRETTQEVIQFCDMPLIANGRAIDTSVAGLRFT